ncbi:unnamed protein product [Musa textilis]
MCICQGATIVDRIVNIAAIENYIPMVEEEFWLVRQKLLLLETTCQILRVQAVLAVNKPMLVKLMMFVSKESTRASATAMVTSFDRQVGLPEKIAAGISIVIEKVKSVGEKLHVSDKTIAALIAAERKLNDTSTAVKTNRWQRMVILQAPEQERNSNWQSQI